MPSLPMSDVDGDGDTEMMNGIRMVIEYSNLTYHEALDLPTDVFLYMLKNRYIEKLEATDEGLEYLETCERIKIKEPDKEALNKYR